MLRFWIFFSCFFAVITDVYSTIPSCNEHQCIAIIDAGSTGSRLHVFAYDLDVTNTPIGISEIWSKKVTPGFATIEVNQSTIDAYLTTLFSGAPTQNLPVYFYATAGMRLLPQVKQKSYYQKAQNWFNQQTTWQLIEAKTISGNDEAIYDWLAVNYHLGKLKFPDVDPVGVMDIGGASVQIAFPIHQISEQNKNSQVTLNLYGQQIHLFIQSFLGLGQNEMAHQFLDTASCFSTNYPLSNGDSGKGDAVKCAQEASLLINQIHNVQNEVQPILATYRISSWYVIGGLSYLAESKPFQFQNNQLTNQDLLEQANKLVCQQPWESLSNQFPNNEFVESYCLLPAYYYALMVDGYGFSEKQIVNYIPSSKNVDWAIGVVLHH
jgi:hypothetical protein